MIACHNGAMRKRRAIVVFIVGTILLVLFAGALPRLVQESVSPISSSSKTSESTVNPGATTSFDAGQYGAASTELEKLEVKGRAPKTGYARDQFGDGWSMVNGCTTRNIILYRDLQNPTLNEECKVLSGTLVDPYSGDTIHFTKEKSSVVQIDHVVALSDAWQKGAQLLSKEKREQLANDPLELLAVSGQQNQAKSDGDAATWLPKNKTFRCEYIARQIAVKVKYALWVTQAEKDAMVAVLRNC